MGGMLLFAIFNLAYLIDSCMVLLLMPLPIGTLHVNRHWIDIAERKD